MICETAVETNVFDPLISPTIEGSWIYRANFFMLDISSFLYWHKLVGGFL